MTPSGLSPEALAFGFEPALDVQVSPDGEMLLFTRWRAESRPPHTWRQRPPGASTHGAHAPVGGTLSEVWACAIDGGHPRRVSPEGWQAAEARLSPQGREVAYVVERGDLAALYVGTFAGENEPQEVARHPGGIAQPTWSGDGQWIAYTTLVDRGSPPGPPLVSVIDRIDYREDLRGFLGEQRSQVHVVELDGHGPRQLTDGSFDCTGPRWSPEGRLLAVQVRTTASWCSQLLVIDAETGDQRRIGPVAGVVAFAAWSPDGHSLAVCGASELAADGGHWNVSIFDLATETLRPLTHDLPWALRADPVWLDDQRLLLLGVRRGGSRLYELDVVDGSLKELVRYEALTSGLSVDDARRLAVQSYESTTRAGEIVVVELATSTHRVVTERSAGVLAASPPGRAESLTVARGDIAIDGWVLHPPDFDPSHRYPVVLDVHGGPQSYVGYGFDILHQCLATNGFLVVYCNPRGSASYGPDFARRVHFDWLGEDYQDILAVLGEVTERSYADSDRVGIMGSSYGGYTCAWAIGQSDRFKAAVASAPGFDLASHYRTMDWHPDVCELQWKGAPHEHPEWYAAHSPSAYAHRARTPTLILHAEHDLRVPVGQSEQMFKVLKAAGCETRYVRYGIGDHLWFHGAHGIPEHRRDVLARTLDWFERHLRER